MINVKNNTPSTYKSNGEHYLGDLGQIISFCVFLVAWILDSFVFKLTVFLSPYIPLQIRIGVLAIFLILAFYILSKGHMVLQIQNSRLLTDGVFGRVRHPLYLAMMLFYFGLTAATASLMSLVLCIFIFCFYNYIAAYEEKYMESKYGSEYILYKQKVRRWIPFKR